MEPYQGMQYKYFCPWTNLGYLLRAFLDNEVDVENSVAASISRQDSTATIRLGEEAHIAAQRTLIYSPAAGADSVHEEPYIIAFQKMKIARCLDKIDLTVSYKSPLRYYAMFYWELATQIKSLESKVEEDFEAIEEEIATYSSQHKVVRPSETKGIVWGSVDIWLMTIVFILPTFISIKLLYLL